MINIVYGSILDAKEKYIAHQCNCLTTGSAGVAKLIFERFPYSDTYSSRTDADVPATIKILGNGDDQRYVINMFGQYYPGKPKYPDATLDGTKTRERYFHQCLMKVINIPELESIAFPYKIGCNLAGGNWNNYFGTLENFSKYAEDDDVTTTIYCPTPETFEDAKSEYKSLLVKMLKQDLNIR